MTREDDRQRLEEDLMTYARTRDQSLRKEIIASNLGLVKQLARRYANRGEALDDLIQAGSIGLIKAVDRFDPLLGFGFDGYATKMIIGEIKRHFRDRGWSVRAPRRVQELYFALGTAIEELSQRNGRSPTLRELAEEARVAEDDIVEALEAGHGYRSASLEFSGQDGIPLEHLLGSEDAQYSFIENHFAFIAELSRLPEREREVARLRFVEDLTQVEISQRLRVSQMHVSRSLARAVRRLHQLITSDTSVSASTNPSLTL